MQGLKSRQSPAARLGRLASGTTGILPADAAGPPVYPFQGRALRLGSLPQRQPLLRATRRHDAARGCSFRRRCLGMSQLNSSNAYSPSRPSSRRWDPGPGQPRLPSAPQREARPGRAFLFCPRRPPAGRGEGKGGGGKPAPALPTTTTSTSTTPGASGLPGTEEPLV